MPLERLQELVPYKEGKITRQQLISIELLDWAERILGMKWITYEQFKDDPKKTCPKCGSEHLITD